MIVGWFLALQFGVWPLAPRRPARWVTTPALASIAGCYEMSLSDWRPPLSLGDDAVFTTPPRTIELTSAAARWRGFQARPASGESRWLPFGFWEVTDERTVSITWTNGFSGIDAEVGPRGADLVGRAQSFWDFPRMTQWASVTATRVRCPGAAPSDRAER